MTGSSRDNLTAFHDQLVIVKMTSFFVISLSIQYTTHYIVYYIIAADGHEGNLQFRAKSLFLSVYRTVLDRCGQICTHSDSADGWGSLEPTAQHGPNHCFPHGRKPCCFIRWLLYKLQRSQNSRGAMEGLRWMTDSSSFCLSSTHLAVSRSLSLLGVFLLQRKNVIQIVLYF